MEPDSGREANLIAFAECGGFKLIQRELDTGQLIWAWQPDDGPQPQFLTRLQAISYMAEKLERLIA